MRESFRGFVEGMIGWKRNAYGGPFNGQQRRQMVVDLALKTFSPEFIIETGTFRGDTTDFFRRYATTYTVEKHQRFFQYSRARFLLKREVHVHRGTRTFLSELSHQMMARPCFIYLDAHWERDLPLAGELRTIASWEQPLVMIDDFKVPHDPGYGFDAYEAGTLSLKYLPPLPDFTVYFPSIPSSEETGARRGYCLLSKKPLAPALLPYFRPADTKEQEVGC